MLGSMERVKKVKGIAKGKSMILISRVGRSKPTPVLTGYNRPGQYSLKWSLLVNTHQSGRLEILSVFCGGLIDIYGQILLKEKQKTF